MTFLADENFPRPALLVLRDAEHDVRSVVEDCPGSSDERAGLAVVLFRVVPQYPHEVVYILRSLIETGVLEAGTFCVATRDRVRTRRLRAE